MNKYTKSIFEYNNGQVGYDLQNNKIDYDVQRIINNQKREKELTLPSASELEVIRHYTNLSQKNFGVESGFYPLGSCTMKYNPKINELVSSFENFATSHPLLNEKYNQGSLKIYYDVCNLLCNITGMKAFSLNPYAGAHGELVGLMLIKQYHMNKKDYKRNKIIIPDSAHGTNPASASVCGFDTIKITSNEDGRINLDSLKKALNDEIAGIMLTNPNTMGMFEKDILEISKLVHQAGGLLYYDGANLNALLGKVKPADMGFDVMHINIHKTFSTPHGGGGPGSGPVGVNDKLVDLLPDPKVSFDGKKYHAIENSKKSIGRISTFYGNFAVNIKAYAYILSLGQEYLGSVANMAVLNANYIKESLKDYYDLVINEACKHEVVFNGLKTNPNNIKTLDISKKLLDYGYHAPTIYFPLIIEQALMIEPTETESKATLDEFISVMIRIAKEAIDNPDLLLNAPQNTYIKRIDEVSAARHPILKYKDIKDAKG
ncbi:MAG: aminomethyl-transferring glycine dehydrogenase subunit GcvPB [Bacilli bacterium]|nr:aminomethyl-transferring glycine dehydrogenase subunit GcvPB [Bacilli bacterium]